MKIINAIWEKRNTGLTTCEIVFEKADTFQTYLDSHIENDYQFSVVKIPVGDLMLVHQLEDFGYRYLENNLVLSLEANQLDDINPLWKRLLKGFSCKLLTTNEELASVLHEVENNMFNTDRYSLDPFWPDNISSKRYSNWIKDLFESGIAQFYVIVKDEKEIGFFSIKKESQNINSCPIAGIFNSYKSAGYIFVLTWFWLVKSRETEIKKLITSISSNNRVMLSSLSKVFAFRICDTFIVMRKILKQT
jgi:hypothetical protein